MSRAGFKPMTARGLKAIGELLEAQQVAPAPGPSLKKLTKAEARAKYEQHIKDHPTGNVAYFDAWGSLSKAAQRKWRDPQYKG